MGEGIVTIAVVVVRIVLPMLQVLKAQADLQDLDAGLVEPAEFDVVEGLVDVEQDPFEVLAAIGPDPVVDEQGAGLLAQARGLERPGNGLGLFEGLDALGIATVHAQQQALVEQIGQLV